MMIVTGKAHQSNPDPAARWPQNPALAASLIEQIIAAIGPDEALDRLLGVETRPVPSLRFEATDNPAEPATASHPSRSLLRDLVARRVDQYQASRAFLDRIKAAARQSDDSGMIDWSDLKRLAADQVQADEASLAYLLDEAAEELAPEGRPIPTGGQFEPFGVVHAGTVIVVRHDPANMAPKILVPIPLDRLVDLDRIETTADHSAAESKKKKGRHAGAA